MSALRHRGSAGARAWALSGAWAFVWLVAGCAASSSSGGNTGDTMTPPTTGSAGSAGSAGSNGSGSGTAGFQVMGGTAGTGTPSGAAGAGGGGFPTGAAGTSTGVAGSFGTAGTTGVAGASGVAGSGAQDAGATDAGTCVVSIESLIPGSFTDLEAGVSSILRLRASVFGYAGRADGGSPAWRWSVKMAGGASLASLNFTPVDDAGSTIDIGLATPGTYQVQATIDGAPACDRAPLVFVVKPPATPAFRFRVTPPAGAQLPTQEVLVKTSEVADGPHVLDLGDRTASALVSLSPADVRGFPIPSYVRITSPSFQFELEGYTGRGALIAPLATALTYDVLLVPDNGLAPLLVSGTPASISSKMAIVAGAAVTGTLRDGNGQAVAGARVILMGGACPSTVGVSGADGTFALTTREGTLAADILPPDGSGLPEAHVSAAPGIALLAGMTSLDLALDWAKVAVAPLAIKVSGPGGQAVVGASVRVDLAASLGNAGTLHVHGATAATLAATGTAHADATTDAQGVAHLGPLPVGTYHVIVAPPAGATTTAITLADVALPAAGVTAPLALAAPLAWSGTLTPAAGAAGAKVTAIDRGLFAPATLATATARADGTYALSLASGRSYELLVEPDPKLGLARSVVGVVTPSASASAGQHAVPPALVWQGTLRGAGRALAGALVQVYCAAPAATCFNPTLALSQGTTAADGTVTLAVPGPPPP